MSQSCTDEEEDFKNLIEMLIQLHVEILNIKDEKDRKERIRILKQDFNQLIELHLPNGPGVA